MPTSSSWYKNLDKEEITQSSKDGVQLPKTGASPAAYVHQGGVGSKDMDGGGCQEFFVLFEITKSNYKKFGELTYKKPAGIAEVTKG